MTMNQEGYPVFKGLQKPLEFMGIRGRFLTLAAAAIAFSGFSTYRKGLSALRRGQLNMNALMGVAVTGAFLIGQWPEAAMVMALYAIAELIEARSVDRARNAIKGLLAFGQVFGRRTGRNDAAYYK